MPTDEDGNEVASDYRGFCKCFSGLDMEQLDVTPKNVSERFPQYEMTDNPMIIARRVYEYLNSES